MVYKVAQELPKKIKRSEKMRNLSENKTDLSENKTNLSENKTNLSENKSDLSENKTDLSENKTDLSKNKSDLSENNIKNESLSSENTRLILVRHGESIGNAMEVMLGHTDLDLSPLGYKQANCTAERLKDVKIDAIYSSDLLRAYNTAKACADMRKMTVSACRELREVSVGIWEGKRVGEIVEKWGDVFLVDWRYGFGTFTFPEGENVMEAGKRFADAVFDIARRHRGECVLIASHAAVIRAFWSMVCGIAPEKIADELPFATNASCSFLEFDGEKMIPISYSEDKHLERVGITVVKTC